MKYIIKLVQENKAWVAFLFILTVVGIILDGFSMLVLLPFLDQLILGGADTEMNPIIGVLLKPLSVEKGLFHIVFVFFIIILIKNAVNFIKTIFTARFNWSLVHSWSVSLMERVLYAPYGEITSDKQGVLLNNIIQEPKKAMKLIEIMIQLISHGLLIIYFYGISMCLNWKFTLLISVVVSACVLLLRRITDGAAHAFGRAQLRINQEVTSFAGEAINGLREVKTFSCEPDIRAEFSGMIAGLAKKIIHFKMISYVPKLMKEIPLVLIVLCFVWIYSETNGVDQLMQNLPAYGLFLVIALRIFNGGFFIAQNKMIFYSLLPSLKIVLDTPSYKDHQDNENDKAEIARLTSDIVFQKVTFGYDENKIVLKNVDMLIPHNKVTVIVGPSGSGKSTIGDLIIGLYQPDSGDIIVNNRKMSEFNINSWRERIGFVAQDSFLFNNTIENNIRVGNKKADKKIIRNAAQQAHADEFIAVLDEQYQTTLTDKGLSLSGGQRQRLAIARALVRDPDVLIFDEVTSALDVDSEGKIMETICELKGKKTIVIITHKEGLQEYADVLYSVNNGAVLTIKRP